MPAAILSISAIWASGVVKPHLMPVSGAKVAHIEAIGAVPAVLDVRRI